MNQRITRGAAELMSFVLELGARFGIDEAFSREEKRHILSSIEENLTCCKRVFLRHPARVNSHLRNKMNSGIIKRLVFHGTHHAFHETLAFVRRSLTDDSNYAG